MKKNNCRCCRVFVPVAVVAFVAVLSYAVMALWNCVVVDIFSAKTITYWQALGLLVLSKIFFGGFPCKHRRFGCGRKDDEMSRHLETLSPELREKVREEMKQRFGAWPRPMCCDSDKESDGAKK